MPPLLSWEKVERWLEHYESLGPTPGIALTVLEAFVPALPLVAIIVANVNAYGFVSGAAYSWLGVVLGAICVFLLSRKFGGRLGSFIERKYPSSRKFVHWVETHGFTPIFLLACFPFTPSSLVNVLSGMSKLPVHTFITATLLGKAVMIAVVSFAGFDLQSLLRQPWKMGVVLVVLLLLWYMGRKLESRFTA